MIKTTETEGRESMFSRRGNGEGTVFFNTRRKKWIAKLTMPDGSRPERSAATKAQARMLLTELEKHRDSFTVTSPHREYVYLADYAQTWLESVVKLQRAPATFCNYKLTINKHIAPYLGDWLLENLNAQNVTDWLRILRESEVGERTRQNAYAILRACLEHAVKNDRLLDENPLNYVDKPRHEREEILPFTIEEARKILGYFESHRLGAAVEIAFRIGLRQGELFGLKRQDVDLKGKTLRITRQACEVGGKIVWKNPKSKAGIRTIELDQDCVDAFIRREAVAMAEGLRSCEILFPSRSGNVMRRSNFGHRHWAPCLRKLGIEHRGFHHVRHTAATMMLSSGVSVATVARVIGHSKPSTTIDIYGHCMPLEGRAAVASISRRIHESG